MNSVPRSTMLGRLTDDEIRAKVANLDDSFFDRAFPGKTVPVGTSLADALKIANANFTVEKRTLTTRGASVEVDDIDDDTLCAVEGESLLLLNPVESHNALVRSDSEKHLGIVGSTYGIVQNNETFEALDILVERGDAQIRNVESIDDGARVRITASIGQTEFLSADGAPNTLGHFVVFTSDHTGHGSNFAQLKTVRIECFNGMTSNSVVHQIALRHTSRAADRMADVTSKILETVIGDVATEAALFASMTSKALSLDEFDEFATEFLGGELTEDATASKKTRRENDVKELTDYFVRGNQGAGPTAWGAYNSVTRWVEAKKEGIEDAKKAAKRFDSNTGGDGQKKIARALKMLTN